MASNPKTAEALIALKELPDDSMLPPNDAAAFLMISESALARMRSEGIDPAYDKANESGGPVHYRKQDLQAWLDAVKAGGKIR